MKFAKKPVRQNKPVAVTEGAREKEKKNLEEGERIRLGCKYVTFV